MAACARAQRSSASAKPESHPRPRSDRMNLENRVALVTGAGHRVGRAIALALGARGMRVAVHYNAAADGAQETLRELEALGTSGATFAADLSAPDGPAALVNAVVAQLG